MSQIPHGFGVPTQPQTNSNNTKSIGDNFGSGTGGVNIRGVNMGDGGTGGVNTGDGDGNGASYGVLGNQSRNFGPGYHWRQPPAAAPGGSSGFMSSASSSMAPSTSTSTSASALASGLTSASTTVPASSGAVSRAAAPSGGDLNVSTAAVNNLMNNNGNNGNNSNGNNENESKLVEIDLMSEDVVECLHYLSGSCCHDCRCSLRGHTGNGNGNGGVSCNKGSITCETCNKMVAICKIEHQVHNCVWDKRAEIDITGDFVFGEESNSNEDFGYIVDDIVDFGEVGYVHQTLDSCFLNIRSNGGDHNHNINEFSRILSCIAGALSYILIVPFCKKFRYVSQLSTNGNSNGNLTGVDDLIQSLGFEDIENANSGGSGGAVLRIAKQNYSKLCLSRIYDWCMARNISLKIGPNGTCIGRSKYMATKSLSIRSSTQENMTIMTKVIQSQVNFCLAFVKPRVMNDLMVLNNQRIQNMNNNNNTNNNNGVNVNMNMNMNMNLSTGMAREGGAQTQAQAQAAETQIEGASRPQSERAPRRRAARASSFAAFDEKQDNDNRYGRKDVKAGGYVGSFEMMRDLLADIDRNYKKQVNSKNGDDEMDSSALFDELVSFLLDAIYNTKECKNKDYPFRGVDGYAGKQSLESFLELFNVEMKNEHIKLNGYDEDLFSGILVCVLNYCNNKHISLAFFDFDESQDNLNLDASYQRDNLWINNYMRTKREVDFKNTVKHMIGNLKKIYDKFGTMGTGYSNSTQNGNDDDDDDEEDDDDDDIDDMDESMQD